MTLLCLFLAFICRYFGRDNKKMNPQWLGFREGAGQIAKELL